MLDVKTVRIAPMKGVIASVQPKVNVQSSLLMLRNYFRNIFIQLRNLETIYAFSILAYNCVRREASVFSERNSLMWS